MESVVLDEADRLLEMGFVDQVDAILAHVIHDNVQRCMVSATMPQGIQELADSILRDPVHVNVGRKGAGVHDERLCTVSCDLEGGGHGERREMGGGVFSGGGG